MGNFSEQLWGDSPERRQPQKTGRGDPRGGDPLTESSIEPFNGRGEYDGVTHDRFDHDQCPELDPVPEPAEVER